MLKKERQIQEFLSTFSFLKGEDVILYGTGQYTELLLQVSLPFRVIGLMDQKKTGIVCYGQPVLNEDAVRHSGCRYMILVANLSSVPAICLRIEAFVSMCGIIVYSMNGCKPLEKPKNISIPSDRIRDPFESSETLKTAPLTLCQKSLRQFFPLSVNDDRSREFFDWAGVWCPLLSGGNTNLFLLLERLLRLGHGRPVGYG